MRHLSFDELKIGDYSIEDDDVPLGTRPRYVLKNNVSRHKHFLKTYSHEAREIWAEVFASRVGEHLGIPIQRASLKRLPPQLEAKFRTDFTPMLDADWKPIAVLVSDVFPAGHSFTYGKNILGSLLERSGEYFSLAEVDEALKGRYFASEDLMQRFAEMLVFDFLIGNMDRHQENWGILSKASVINQMQLLLDAASRKRLAEARRFSPLFDHGSSLLFNLPERKVNEFLAYPERFRKEYVVEHCKSFFTYKGKQIPLVRLIGLHVNILKDEWGVRFRKAIETMLPKLSKLDLARLILVMPNDPLLEYDENRKKLLLESLSIRAQMLKQIIDSEMV